MASRVYTERRSLRLALEDYLSPLGWDVVYKEGWQSDATITVPTVAITFLKWNKRALQMGDNNPHLFIRPVQIDCYMEREDRAIGITDAIADFMELVPIQIVDSNNNFLGNLICFDDSSISANLFPLLITAPNVLHWRGITKGTYEAQYP